MTYRVGDLHRDSPPIECDGLDAAMSYALNRSRLFGATVFYVADESDKLRLVYRGEVFVRETKPTETNG